jgi:AbrB family looped-hinge helix DNA binding protein
MTTVAIAKVRRKGQVTLPSSIRQAAHIEEGAVVEFAVAADGTVTLRPKALVDADDAWYWTPEWQAGERKVDKEIARGEGTAYDNVEEFLTSLDQ